MRAQLLPIFPEPVVEYKNISADQARIEGLYDRQEWKHTNAGENPEYFLKISKNLRVLDEDQDLKRFFVEIINVYASDIMLYTNKFHMTTSWFTKTEKNKISVLHNHGNAMFSAVYYFGLNSGLKSRITFEKPVASQFDLKPKGYNALNGPSHIFEMGNDSLLIFPSYLKHKVNSHDYSEVRKSLAMNFIPNGVIGDDTNAVHLLGPDF